jgi:hypothetical protein
VAELAVSVVPALTRLSRFLAGLRAVIGLTWLYVGHKRAGLAPRSLAVNIEED